MALAGGATAQTCDQALAPLMPQLDQHLGVMKVQESLLQRHGARYAAAATAKTDTARDAALMLMLTVGFCDTLRTSADLLADAGKLLAQPMCRSRPDSVREAIRQQDVKMRGLLETCNAQAATYEATMAARMTMKK